MNWPNANTPKIRNFRAWAGWLGLSEALAELVLDYMTIIIL